MRLWFPGATRQPGPIPGGYWRAGRTRMRAVKIHYTVGINSAYLGRQGYFQFLIRRDGEVVQFCPTDGYCWDSGEWNREGPGVELEFYPPVDGPAPANIVTGDQITSAGRLFRWLHSEHAFPLSFYDGPRIARGYRGFITHRSLRQRVQHHNYITHAQWNQIIEPGSRARPAPTTREAPDMILIGTTDGKHHLLAPGYAGTVSPPTYLKLASNGLPHAEDVHPLEYLALLRDIAGVDLSKLAS